MSSMPASTTVKAPVRGEVARVCAASRCGAATLDATTAQAMQNRICFTRKEVWDVRTRGPRRRTEYVRGPLSREERQVNERFAH
jgi:hypothetical protein